MRLTIVISLGSPYPIENDINLLGGHSINAGSEKGILPSLDVEQMKPFGQSEGHRILMRKLFISVHNTSDLIF